MTARNGTGDFDDEVVITIDVEWAADEVLHDTLELLDERGVTATFFCTHAGIDVPGHERALHPNFRRSRNTLAQSAESAGMDDREFYRYIVTETQKFCPEAVGTRGHSLFWDSDLLPVYSQAGIEYDSSTMLPLAQDLSPAWKGSGILEIPIYYMDHWDLLASATDLSLDGMSLRSRGLKVMVFHPNLIFLNAASLADVARSKPRYHDVDWLLDNRRSGPGTRTLFVELLETLSGRATRSLASINAECRAADGRAAPASR